jgi:PAS domain S-box-containing protein
MPESSAVSTVAPAADSGMTARGASAPVAGRRSRPRVSFSIKINFLLGLGLAILLAVGTLAYRSIDELVDSSRYEGAALAELARLEAFLGRVKRIESAQRKFVLTGDEADLQAYRAVRGEGRFDLQGTAGFSANFEQRALLRELERVAAERVKRLDAAVEARSLQGLVAATRLVASSRGEALNGRLDELAEQFRSRELRSLRVRQEDTAFSAGTSSFLIAWGIAFALALLVWTMVIIQRHQSRRREAELALRASEAQLRLITDAVPALIGYADRDGRMQFHNKPFERWLARPPEKLHGFTLRNLLGDDTFDRIEPHIAQVLAGRDAQFEFSFDAPAAQGAGGGAGTAGRADFSAQLVPRSDPNGQVQGFYLLVTDITALKEVDRMKSEFVSTVSHELRTPLTSIRGSLGLLAAGVTGPLPDKARQLVKIAVENCERLVRLVNDILDSEKMASGKMEMKLQVLDLGALVERSIRANEGFAATHGASVRFDPGAQPLQVRADEDRLAQVVTNLLSNACKFSAPNGRVEVVLARVGNAARVMISDNGPGVAPEFRARLFERFARSDSSDARRAGGTGLGLNICRGIVEKLGGSIAYEARAGGGSSFHFELPMVES